VKLAASLKAPVGDGALKFLRQMPAQELLTALGALGPGSSPRLGPDVDGWAIPRSPSTVFASGQEAAIPLMFGTTNREFAADGMGLPTTADHLRGMISEVAGGLAPQALAAYGLADGGQGSADPFYGSAADQWAADIAFRCPATTQGAWHNSAHHPTYEYEFDHAIPGQEAQGAVHSADLPYVFGYFPKKGNISGGFGDADFKLSQLMETYWTNFAKAGDPNSSGVPEWPQFGDAQTFIQFTQDGQVATTAKLRGRQCDLYRQALAERIKNGQ